MSEWLGWGLQVSGWSGAQSLHAEVGGTGSAAYKGMMDCFSRTVSEEGWQALFKVCTHHAAPYAILCYCLDEGSCVNAIGVETWRTKNAMIIAEIGEIYKFVADEAQKELQIGKKFAKINQSPNCDPHEIMGRWP